MITRTFAMQSHAVHHKFCPIFWSGVGYRISVEAGQLQAKSLECLLIRVAFVAWRLVTEYGTTKSHCLAVGVRYREPLKWNFDRQTRGQERRELHPNFLLAHNPPLLLEDISLRTNWLSTSTNLTLL